MLSLNIIVFMFCFFLLFLTLHSHSQINLASSITKPAFEKPTTNAYSGIGLVLLLTGAFFLRVILSILEPGYPVDIGCFSSWADGAYRLGLGNFYSKIGFCDYTPGYIYILWCIGALRAHITVLANSVFLIKLPAILCDLITGCMIYKLAKKNFSNPSALMLAGLYLIHPVILIDSAMWGQVDSVYTLFLFLTLYSLSERKSILAYFFFAIGCLLKLQTLVLFPVLFAAFLIQVCLQEFSVKRLFQNLLGGISAILLMYLMILPFQFDHYGLGFLTLSKETLSSYQYVTVNAYNFWELFALNWHSQTETFLGITYAFIGTFFLVCMTVCTIVLLLRHHKKNIHGNYFLAASFLIGAFFTFSVRVHERYMFPIFVCLLCAYIYYPVRSLLYAFCILTVSQANNIWHAFKYYDAANFDWNAPLPRLIAWIGMIGFGYLVFLCISILIREKVWIKKDSQNTASTNLSDEKKSPLTIFHTGIKPTPSQPKVTFTKWDYLAVCIITLLYAAVALVRVGNKEAPTSSYETLDPTSTLTFDFTNQNLPVCVYYYNGRRDNRTYQLQQSNDLTNWSPVFVNYTQDSTLTMYYPFCWSYALLDTSMPYLQFLVPEDGTALNELVFLDANGQKLLPKNAGDYEVLFDEQDMWTSNISYMSGTYFDEIYHARTAYEIIEGLPHYEWTHPPLGKIIISIGIRLFGMCPFGWRIMGVLFGILMLPPFYYLAKLLLKDTRFATLTCFLLATDFMHFTQTRIATIDVFVTFFIIWMYLWMYRYCQMSFFDTSFKKTCPVLFLSGICMVLGCASKWTGIYAGIGLGILFLVTMLKRYLEYIYATKHPTERINGIRCQTITQDFFPNLFKTCLVCIPAFILIPGLIYVLSYIPFSDGSADGVWLRMLHNQQSIWYYHSTLDATHPFSSVWYEWIWDKRPVLYASDSLSNGLRSCISAFGNPLIWWLGIPAFVYQIYQLIHKKSGTALLLVIGYLSQLTPWIAVTRCTFTYHYFPAVPFLILMIGNSAWQFYQVSLQKPKKQNIILLSFSAYVLLTGILFAMFYPVLSGYPVRETYIDTYLSWVSSWQLY